MAAHGIDVREYGRALIARCPAQTDIFVNWPAHSPNALAFARSKRPRRRTEAIVSTCLGVYTYADFDIAPIQYFIGRLSGLFLD